MMPDNNLLRGYNTPDEICKNCKFYYANMRPWDVAQIQSNNETPEYVHGQKYCIKNHHFVFFNDYCINFVKPEN